MFTYYSYTNTINTFTVRHTQLHHLQTLTYSQTKFHHVSYCRSVIVDLVYKVDVVIQSPITCHLK